MTQPATHQLGKTQLGKTQLGKTLTLPGAIALALGICIGAGLLVLTGLAYQRSEGAAIYAWLIDGAMIVPILLILALLGARHPNAEGVAGIVRSAFGNNAAVGVQALLIGTFSLGLPSIAIVGGNYFAFLAGADRPVAMLAAAAILLFAGACNYLGARLSGGVQRIFTFSLLTVVVGIGVCALVLGDHAAGVGVAPLQQWPQAVPSLHVIFFAFTGWILVASTVEEYKNPARDYPLVIFLSFGIVLGLYLLIALATQLTLAPDDPNLSRAPVAAILSAVFGDMSGRAVALLGVLIVTANLNGATWAFSRLLMASARGGLLPSPLAVVNPKSAVPSNAVIAATSLFLAVLSLHAAGWVRLETLLGLAGQNFFILYLLCVVSFVKIISVFWLRSLAIALGAVYVIWAARYGATLLYPAMLIATGIAVFQLKGRAPKTSLVSGSK